ncbi:VOC family protein [Streptomyces sp. NRRL B-1347]|uniref:VOC family protein n=1 Tax=Streptomyces sp. NRRL B-1347 TaxID=1476877 RepID=UPI00068EA484|nr:VOC family protein [Streptomyces sp. NRRL B-1347]
MSPELTYTVLTPAGGSEENSHGGLMQLPRENPDAGSTPERHPHFEVADVDASLARAAEAGATVVVPAADAEASAGS